MTERSFEALAELMRRIFGQPNIAISPQTTADEVPGWDSLSHVMLMLEIEKVFGVLLRADETVSLPNVGALYASLVAAMKANEGQLG